MEQYGKIPNNDIMNNSVLARNLLLMKELEDIICKCEKAHLRIMLLKGSALLAGGFVHLQEREMSDIDLLIDENRESELENILKI